MTKAGERATLSVPDHDELGAGTLRKLSRQAGLTLAEERVEGLQQNPEALSRVLDRLYTTETSAEARELAPIPAKGRADRPSGSESRTFLIPGQPGPRPAVDGAQWSLRSPSGE